MTIGANLRVRAGIIGFVWHVSAWMCVMNWEFRFVIGLLRWDVRGHVIRKVGLL